MIVNELLQETTNLGFVVNREQVFQSLAYINSIVERKGSISVLSCVKIEAQEKGIIKLTSTDLDVSIVASVNAEVTSFGVVAVSAQMLHDIIKKLPAGSCVEFTANNSKISIVCGCTNFSLPIIDSEKFPDIEINNLEHNFSLTTKSLSLLLSKTKFAISSEETRYNLNGVYFHTDDNMLCCAATDGHRLSLIKIDRPSNIHSDFAVIIPKKTVNEIFKIISNSESDTDEISISLSDRKVCFTYKNYIIISKLIDGEFPPYRTIIPKSNDKTIFIDSNLLRETIDRVSVVVSDKIKPVKILLSRDKLILNSVSSDESNASEHLDVKYDRQDLSIGFNAKYLMDILSCIEGKQCRFSFLDNTTAVLIEDLEMPNATYIIMPMRI